MPAPELEAKRNRNSLLTGSHGCLISFSVLESAGRDHKAHHFEQFFEQFSDSIAQIAAIRQPNA
jgi:hypothetical protein